jgi:glycosyltransferase involved in cell wall biosynthesis
MSIVERGRAEQAEIPRLENRLAIHSAQVRYLSETLADIEASNAWAVASYLARWRRRFLPDGSRRNNWFRIALRGLRLWRREGLRALLRRLYGRLRRRAAAPASEEKQDRLRPTAKANAEGLRIVFIGSSAPCEAQSMRYRAHNVLEALALLGVQGIFLAQEQIPSHLDSLLSHDLIVLVRLPQNHYTRMATEAARRRGVPVAFDIDDYLFEPWVMPYIEVFQRMPRAVALRILDTMGASLLDCDYFIGSTSYLAEKAASLGKPSFTLPNGLNALQLDLARQALRQRQERPRDGLTRLGYFSGTHTHQADFRVVYPALMDVLRHHREARLVIVGDLDVGEFPGLTLHAEQIEILPLRPWTQLPEILAAIDINLIPLDATPFNEGKSNLKYFEAGLLKVPSIASPTCIHRQSIVDGHNGLLAATTAEWRDALEELLGDAERRATLGQNAFEHVLRTYAPLATATEALAVYRHILQHHRAKRAA